MSIAIPGTAGRFIRKGRRWSEDAGKVITFASASLLVVVIVAIFWFIASKGTLIFLRSQVPAREFFFGTNWLPVRSTRLGGPVFGAAPFIAGSLAVTALAVIIAAPVGIIGGLFLTEVAPLWARRIFRPAIEVFVGIPSVVYGWVGITVLVPKLAALFGGTGFSLLAGGLVLAVMILPTITTVAGDALASVPRGLHEGSYGLGATRWQTLWRMAIPAAAPGIAAGVVLGIARAIGEALAVQMVIGNVPLMPTSLTRPMSTLTSEITMDMANTVPGERLNNVLWTMALVLLVIALGLNLLIRAVARRREVRAS